MEKYSRRGSRRAGRAGFAMVGCGRGGRPSGWLGSITNQRVASELPVPPSGAGRTTSLVTVRSSESVTFVTGNNTTDECSEVSKSKTKIGGHFVLSQSDTVGCGICRDMSLKGIISISLNTHEDAKQVTTTLHIRVLLLLLHLNQTLPPNETGAFLYTPPSCPSK